MDLYRASIAVAEPSQPTSSLPATFGLDCSAERSSDDGLPRRAFCLLTAALAIAGCAPDASQNRTLPAGGWGGATTTPPPAPLPRPTPPPVAVASRFPGVLPRSAWARGAPEPSLMNPMLPVRYITVHHDGLDRLETGSARPAMADRIELYRSGHRAKGWGDIGYHFVIDRAGTVWEGRDLRWQGAHVKDRNEGNIGILVMGNFEIQQPTAAQLRALRDHVRVVAASFSVPWTRVFSHREWPGAETLCPGRNLQREFVALRDNERRSASAPGRANFVT